MLLWGTICINFNQGGFEMKNIYYYILSITVILLFILIFSPVHAEDNLIFTRIDPAHDDFGPGNYVYPQHEIFQDKGLFDITKVSVYDRENHYEFNFHFTKLVDVWNSRFGFSLPIIQIYIDNEKGGSDQLFEPGAQVRLNPENPWNKLLIVNGWWISLYTPDDSNKRVVDFTVTGQEVPWLINDPDIDVNNNLIKLNIEKDKLGSLDNAYLYILVGSFDPFGYDYFRGIRNEKNSWFFAAPNTEDLTYAPRVIDLIVPPEMDQKEILSNYNDDYPQIEPIYIGQKKMFGEYGIYIYLIIFALLLIISYIAVKTYKKRSGVTDNVDKKEQESD